jgi:hypothetical protein
MRVLVCLLMLLPALAFAQDEDLLAPLPAKKAQKHHKKSKSKTVPPAATAPAAPVQPPASPAAPAPTPAPAPGPAAKSSGTEDELQELAPLELPTTMSIHVAGGVKDAQVSVDGENWGKAPISSHPLKPGEHRIVIRRPGFADYSRTVQVAPGARGQVNAMLEATAGVLAITSVPPGADVTIDGRAVGQTPLPQVTLPPGSYELRVRHQGYMDDVSRLAVRAGRDYPIELTLVPNPASDRPTAVALVPQNTGNEAVTGEVSHVAEPTPWYKHWYVWAGVGVVAAGAAVAVAASSGTKGSAISSSTVCGGSCAAVINPP